MECGLTTLETRRLMGYFSTGKITRGHEFTLVKGRNRLDVRKYCLPQRTGNEWNQLLSTDCMQSSSINMCRNRIYTYLVRVGYT